MEYAKHSAKPSLIQLCKTPGMLIAVGAILIIAATFGLWHFYHPEEKGTALPDPQITVATSLPEPAEARPPATARYDVPADQPRSISLPSIGAEGYIQRVGLGKDNAVVAPTNVNFAGWYVAEGKPGDDGVSLIDGHVQGFTQPGIFKRLNELKPGDTFSIEFGDHSRREFQVATIRNYSVEEAGKRMLEQDPTIKQQLNLITCTGAYDKAKQGYDQRLLVVSRRIQLL